MSFKDVFEQTKKVNEEREYRWEFEEIGQGHYYTSLIGAVQDAMKASRESPDKVVKLEMFKPDRVAIARFQNGKPLTEALKPLVAGDALEIVKDVKDSDGEIVLSKGDVVSFYDSEGKLLLVKDKVSGNLVYVEPADVKKKVDEATMEPRMEYWIKAVLSNDEAASDEELVNLFMKEAGLSDEEARKWVAKRGMYLRGEME